MQNIWPREHGVSFAIKSSTTIFFIALCINKNVTAFYNEVSGQKQLSGSVLDNKASNFSVICVVW